MSGPVLVVGAGPGIGASVARRFGRAGHPVGLVARDRSRLERLAAELRAAGVPRVEATAGDVTDPDGIAGALDALVAALGGPEVVCVSPLPDVRLIRPVLDTTPADMAAALALSVVGATSVVRAVLPAMLARGAGSLLFTTGGAAVRPNPERAVSAVAYAALASYLDLLARTLPERGIRVHRATIVGPVGPGLTHEPDDVADHLYRQHAAPGDPVSVLT